MCHHVVYAWFYLSVLVSFLLIPVIVTGRDYDLLVILKIDRDDFI